MRLSPAILLPLLVGAALVVQLPSAHATLDTVVDKLNKTVVAVKAAVDVKKAAKLYPEGLKLIGTITCYVDDATGLVAGLKVGSAAALCDTTSTPHSFVVPAGSYVSSVKVAVDKDTALVGQLRFTVKSSSSLLPTNVVECGTRGGVPTELIPKLTALTSLTATCVPLPANAAGPRPAAATTFIDPATLHANVTKLSAADDPPTSPSSCTFNADCKDPTPACINGNCAECPNPKASLRGLKQADSCPFCSTNADCKDTATPVCNDNECAECKSDGDCKDLTVCTNGKCVCPIGSSCPPDVPELVLGPMGATVSCLADEGTVQLTATFNGTAIANLTMVTFSESSTLLSVNSTGFVTIDPSVTNSTNEMVPITATYMGATSTIPVKVFCPKEGCEQFRISPNFRMMDRVEGASVNFTVPVGNAVTWTAVSSDKVNNPDPQVTLAASGANNSTVTVRPVVGATYVGKNSNVKIFATDGTCTDMAVVLIKNPKKP